MARSIPARKSSPLPPAARKGANLLKVLGTIGQVTLLGLMAPTHSVTQARVQLAVDQEAKAPPATIQNDVVDVIEVQAEAERELLLDLKA
jgi:hypothetical protein